MSVAEITEATQYLTFTLDEEVFGVDISKVREVLDFVTVTKVPQVPEFMRGVINLRGGVVPVVDMRIKFGMPTTEKTVDTCIVIVEIELGGDITVIGALADSVKEVMDLNPDQIEPAPKIGTKLNTEFIRGMGKKGEEFVIILDIDKVFSCDELAVARDVGQENSSEETEKELI